MRRKKKNQSTQCDPEKMLRYLNRFKLKKKQIKYKPRTYANLQGINSLRSQNAINIEPLRPVIKESVKARLDCNLNALLQMDKETNLHNNNNRRIKPQESYINMELNVARKDPKQKTQQMEVDSESKQDQLSKSVDSDFALDPLNSDYRSDFEACFGNQTENLLNSQNYEEFNISRKQKRNRETISGSKKSPGKEIDSDFHDSFEQSDNCFGFSLPDVSLLDSNPSCNEYSQLERIKQKESKRNVDAIAKQEYHPDDWESSIPSNSLNQRSQHRFVFTDPHSKFPSNNYSDGRFNRYQHNEITKSTRANSMKNNAFYEKNLTKTSLRSDAIAKQEYHQDDWEFSMPSKSLNQRSKNRFVLTDPFSKFPSNTYSDGRFSRYQHKEMTKSTRANSMVDNALYEKNLTKTSLRSDAIAKQEYHQDDWEFSMPSKSLNQRSKNRFVLTDPPSKFPSNTYSDGRFNRYQHKGMTKSTRANSMIDNAFYEKNLTRTSRPEKTASKTKQRNDETFDSSLQAFERNKNSVFVNSPLTVYSSVGSEYVESWDTVRNGVKAGHGNEPPTLPGIPHTVFSDRPIHYVRSSCKYSWNHSGSNVLSALPAFAQSMCVPKCVQNVRPSVLTARFTRTVIRGQNVCGEIIHQELRKSR